MKKTLSMLAVLGIFAFAGVQSAEAFTWSNLNPFTWGRCNKCEQKKIECPCQTRTYNDCPCPTGGAAPCNPCQKVIKQKPCDACDRLQNEMAK